MATQMTLRKGRQRKGLVGGWGGGKAGGGGKGVFLIGGGYLGSRVKGGGRVAVPSIYVVAIFFYHYYSPGKRSTPNTQHTPPITLKGLVRGVGRFRFSPAVSI